MRPLATAAGTVPKTKADLLEHLGTCWFDALARLAAGGPGDDRMPASEQIHDVYEAVCRQQPPDSLAALGSWAFVQAMPTVAGTVTTAAAQRSMARGVTLEQFDEWMRSNLDHPDWVTERAQWKNVPLSARHVH